MSNSGSDRIRLQTSMSPEIYIQKIDGNLRIRGWDRPEIRADSSKADTLLLTHEDEIIKITCDSDCILRVPVESVIKIDEVNGELMLKSLEHQLEANLIKGQVLAKSVGALSMQTVVSNLNAKYIEGNLSCNQVKGNANIQDAEGKITIDECKGNLTIRGFSTAISAFTKGNANLRLDPKTGGDFHIIANGNIHCKLEPDANANVQIISNSENIKLDIFGSKESIKAKEHQFDVGEGDSKIVLEARGIVDFISPIAHEADWGFEFDFEEDISSIAEDISQVVTDQIEQQMHTLTNHINRIASQIPGSQIEQKTIRNLEAKRKKLERKLARVEQRARQRAHSAERRVSFASRRYSGKPKSTGDPVTDQERQKVLEMLQNQQISVNEAEILLSALEGKSPSNQDG